MDLSLADRCQRVRVLFCDVDGVLTDAGVWYDAHGEAMKRFDMRDGQGLALLRSAGVAVHIITREHSEPVVRRMEKLGLAEALTQQATDKLLVVREVLSDLGVEPERAAFAGDDLGDVEAMRHVGFAVAVADAVEAVRDVAHHVTRAPGGHGAVRELCELLLDAQRAPRILNP